ncbi:tex1p [Saccharomyces arboricola H-6]|uniref:Tex1p n=1 Tax=Saccharomyces arboricola (strain H-6 / AS 2.3317 / CBS 10644) TaxID=1160507 RepID=J8LJ60_SACAR|nr:tex1p [Saccharomyces arboricola H-6]
MSSSETIDILGHKTITSEVAASITSKYLQSTLSKSNTSDIEDERFIHVSSRSHSRFTSTPITPNEVLSLKFHVSGSSMAYSRMDGSLTVWFIKDASFDKSVKVFMPDCCGSDKLVTDFSWNPTSLHQMAVVSNSSEISLLLINEITLKVSKLRTLSLGSKTKANNCLYDPLGNWLLAVTKSEKIYLFDVKEDHSLVCSLNVGDISPSDNDAVYSTAWSNNGSNLFVGFKSGYLVILKANKGMLEVFTKIKAHTSSITSIKIDPWGRYFITGSSDGNCYIWSLNSLCCELIIQDLDSAVIALDVCHLGKILGICTDDEMVYFYDLNNGQLIQSKSLANYKSDLVLKFYPDKSWYIMSGKNDTLSNHFVKNERNLITYWKDMVDSTIIEKRRKNNGNDTNHNRRAGKNSDRTTKDRPSRFNSRK